MSQPLRILTIIDYYLPGYRGGGPIRTIANLVESLGDEFAFFVLTSDRDFKSRTAYPSFEPALWHCVGKAQVMYLPPSDRLLWRWQQRLVHLDYDLTYLNGFFSTMTICTLLLRRLGLVPRKPVILAPRGEFSSGALGLKKTKKMLYLTLSKWINLYDGVIWQASSEYERQDIINALKGSEVRVSIAPNLVSAQSTVSTDNRGYKVRDSLRMVFLSRVARKKNLDYALKLLTTLRGDITFDIYGTIEDVGYWQECQVIIKQMPANVHVTYQGELCPDQVEDVLSKYQLFLFPTRGENFGHVIAEALKAGCPVLVSDTTPWQDLEEKRAGWVLPLSQPEQFQIVLNTVVEMDNSTFQEWSGCACIYGKQVASDPTVLEANRRLFINALAQNNDRG